MYEYVVRSNKELLAFIEDVARATDEYLNSDARSIEELESFSVTLDSDLILSQRVLEEIRRNLTYFKGLFNGNGNTLFIKSNTLHSLFSSTYNTTFKDLNIEHIEDSRGFILAHDATNVFCYSCEVKGVVNTTESSSLFFLSATKTTFKDCKINAQMTVPGSWYGSEMIQRDPISVGFFLLHSLSQNEFIDCVISGSIEADSYVGGFVANSTNEVFKSCSAIDLTLRAKLRVGTLAGLSHKTVEVDNLYLQNVTVDASFFLGGLIGESHGKLRVEGLATDNLLIAPKYAASYVGGICGKANEIEISNSQMQGQITGNFIIAGISPDVVKVKLSDTDIQFSIVALGYGNMHNNAYLLANDIFLNSRGKELEMELVNVHNMSTLEELALSGKLNPFKEVI